MRFSKKLSYKLAKPLTTLALVAASFGCNKGESEDLTPIHDTEYIIGFDKVPNLDKFFRNVGRSADSASVRNVILRGDCKSWGGAYTPSEIREILIEPALQAAGKNQYKVIGRDTLPYLGMCRDILPERYKQEQRDSAWLRDEFGLIISPVYYYKSLDEIQY